MIFKPSHRAWDWKAAFFHSHLAAFTSLAHLTSHLAHLTTLAYLTSHLAHLTSAAHLQEQDNSNAGRLRKALHWFEIGRRLNQGLEQLFWAAPLWWAALLSSAIVIKSSSEQVSEQPESHIIGTHTHTHTHKMPPQVPRLTRQTDYCLYCRRYVVLGYRRKYLSKSWLNWLRELDWLLSCWRRQFNNAYAVIDFQCQRVCKWQSNQRNFMQMSSILTILGPLTWLSSILVDDDLNEMISMKCDIAEYVGHETKWSWTFLLQTDNTISDTWDLSSLLEHGTTQFETQEGNMQEI